VAEQAVNLQHKLAFPAVTIVMTLLAIPFGVTTGKEGRALRNRPRDDSRERVLPVADDLHGHRRGPGVLPPALAAWGPNILFGAGALFLMLTVRT
jgi:lipopolysaccharide export LptBFGC system permease protein LptF